jgi:hypothetical protein
VLAVCAAGIGSAAVAAAAALSPWLPLDRDGVHDPRGPGITQLQQPAEALAPLPRDSAGNMVRWVQALERSTAT